MFFGIIGAEVVGVAGTSYIITALCHKILKFLLLVYQISLHLDVKLEWSIFCFPMFLYQSGVQMAKQISSTLFTVYLSSVNPYFIFGVKRWSYTTIHS